MDIVIPSMIDPGMAPPGQARDVDLRAVRAVRAQRRLDRREARGVRRRGDRHARALRAEHQVARSSHRQVLTPADIERITGLTEGNIFQGELSLQQLFFLRPARAWAQYRTPIRGYYQCGSGTHPGRRHHGRVGPARRARDPGGRAMSATHDAIVIGAGLNGLAAAAYLARAGRRVARARAPAE